MLRLFIAVIMATFIVKAFSTDNFIDVSHYKNNLRKNYSFDRIRKPFFILFSVLIYLKTSFLVKRFLHS